MIVELSVACAALVLGGLSVLARRRRKVTHAIEAVFPARALRAGDAVVLSGEHLWISGLITVVDDEPVGTLLRTPPDGGAWLFERRMAGGTRCHLHRMREDPSLAATALPDPLRVDGVLLSMQRQGSASLHPSGEELPTWARACNYRVYGALDGKLALSLELVGGTRVVLVGTQLDLERIDVLPGPTRPT